MRTIANSEFLLPGYWIHEATGAFMTLPWPTDPDERERIARESLGPALIVWSEGGTKEPGLMDYQTGKPWRWTPGQKRFLTLWYHIDPETGRFDYRSAVKRGAKGTGKDPMGAAICNCELVGPVEWAGWDKEGRPRGQPRAMPLVQVISNSEAQSADVLRIANAMWSRDARLYYGIDCGITRTMLKPSGGRLEIPPTSEKSGEGDPATHIMLNETEHSTESGGGARVARMARRNAGKSPSHIQARVIEYCNAHRPGDGSIAEQSFAAWQRQQARGYEGRRDILYDSIEAPPNVDVLTEEGRQAGLAAAYADAPWADPVRLSAEMCDSRTPVSDTVRFYLNGLAMAEDAWVEPAAFDALAAVRSVADRDQIALFLDCSKSGDATALAAVRLDDMYVFAPSETYVWERPPGIRARETWRAPRNEVDAVVDSIFTRFDVAWFGVDPSPAVTDDDPDRAYWADLIDAWHRRYRRKVSLWATPGEARGSAVLFDLQMARPGAAERNRVFTETSELLMRWIDEDGLASPLRHDGNADLRRHVHNARQRLTPWGCSLSKESRMSTRHIDLAVCMVGAVMGARLVLNSGRLRRRGAGKGRTVIMR